MSSALPHEIQQESRSFNAQRDEASATFTCRCGAVFPFIEPLKHTKPDEYLTWDYELARRFAENNAYFTAKSLIVAHVESMEAGGYGYTTKAEIKKPTTVAEMRQRDIDRGKTAEERFADNAAIARAEQMAKDLGKNKMFDGESYKVGKEETVFDLDGYSTEVLIAATMEAVDELPDEFVFENKSVYDTIHHYGD